MLLRNKLIAVGIILSIVIGGFVVFKLNLNNDDSEIKTLQCNESALFYNAATDNYNKSMDPDSKIHLNSDGHIKYLFDDFSGYSSAQLLVDGFESEHGWKTDPEIQLNKSDEFYGGFNSLELKIPPELHHISISKEFTNLNFEKFGNDSYFTMWIKVPHPEGLDEVSIIMMDENRIAKKLEPLVNVHTVEPNTFSNDSDYPDLTFPYGDPRREQWTDFMIGPGWNFLFWKLDTDENSSINISKIQEIKLEIALSGIGQTILLDDLRIQVGLQKESNPTNGFWYPPHGRPQYGVYDIDIDDNGESNLRLLNVKNSQYPSNGDHARMITSAPLAEDFLLRVNFNLLQLGIDDKETINILEMSDVEIKRTLLDNTWFRVTYDFEPDWDPGRDWFGTYISMEYDKFGLVTVWPVERNTTPEQEPIASSPVADQFIAEENVEYEIHLLVEGQKATAMLYEVIDSCMQERAKISYVFERQRHEERYPLAIESTGNVRTVINEVEIIGI